LKFLVDMPITPDAVRHLKAAGHEAVHVSDIGLFDASDEQILDRARVEGCVIVTADLDYPRLMALHRHSAPGIVLFRGGNYSDSEMLDLLDRVLDRMSDADVKGSLTVVDRRRVRRHRLPVGE
jgi:predicted nuclease of predicted toxin-antitoxin system